MIKKLIGGGIDLGGTVVNEACFKRGQELTKEAKESHKKRRADNFKECQDAAYEAAGFLTDKARGVVHFVSPDCGVRNLMSNADRIRMGVPQDDSLPDYISEKELQNA